MKKSVQFTGILPPSNFKYLDIHEYGRMEASEITKLLNDENIHQVILLHYNIFNYLGSNHNNEHRIRQVKRYLYETPKKASSAKEIIFKEKELIDFFTEPFSSYISLDRIREKLPSDLFGCYFDHHFNIMESTYHYLGGNSTDKLGEKKVHNYFDKLIYATTILNNPPLGQYRDSFTGNEEDYYKRTNPKIRQQMISLEPMKILVAGIIGNKLFLINQRFFYRIHDYIVNCNKLTPESFYQPIYEKWNKKIRPVYNSTDITLGADPELVLYKKIKNGANYNQFMSASYYINDGSRNKEVGLDGNSEIIELRPKPSISPSEITRNIRKNLIKLNDIMSRSGATQQFFLHSGGGYDRSIGGHIHFGNQSLKSLSDTQLEPLLTLLDDFIYLPIKCNMIGSARRWNHLGEVQAKIKHNYSEGRITEASNSIELKETLKDTKLDINHIFDTNFEGTSKQRPQPHGIEYRSLPSFIADPIFTRLIFKLAQGIASKFLENKMGQDVTLEYENPPEKKDYAPFLKPKEIDQLWQYYYGDKKDIFLDNVFESWKIKSILKLILTSQLGNRFQGAINSIKKNAETAYIKDIQKLGKNLVIRLDRMDRYFAKSYPADQTHEIWKNYSSFPLALITKARCFGITNQNHLGQAQSHLSDSDSDIGIFMKEPFANTLIAKRKFSSTVFYIIQWYFKHRNLTSQHDIMTNKEIKKTQIYKDLQFDSILEDKDIKKKLKQENKIPDFNPSDVIFAPPEQPSDDAPEQQYSTQWHMVADVGERTTLRRDEQ